LELQCSAVDGTTTPYPIGGSIVERDEPTLVLGIHICFLLQEVLHHVQVVVASCGGRGTESERGEKEGGKEMVCQMVKEKVHGMVAASALMAESPHERNQSSELACTTTHEYYM